MAGRFVPMVNDTISLTLHDTIAARRLLGLPLLSGDRRFFCPSSSQVGSGSSRLAPAESVSDSGCTHREAKRIIKKKEPRTRGDL